MRNKQKIRNPEAFEKSSLKKDRALQRHITNVARRLPGVIHKSFDGYFEATESGIKQLLDPQCGTLNRKQRHLPAGTQRFILVQAFHVSTLYATKIEGVPYFFTEEPYQPTLASSLNPWKLYQKKSTMTYT